MLKPQAVFKATLKEVRSADDLVLQVEVGLAGLFLRRRVRLAGVDAPDTHNQPAESLACRLRDEVQSLLSVGCVVEVDRESNGDIVGRVYYAVDGGWVSLNDMLVDRGYVFNRAVKGVIG